MHRLLCCFAAYASRCAGIHAGSLYFSVVPAQLLCILHQQQHWQQQQQQQQQQL
jgi:hypothetical protein